MPRLALPTVAARRSFLAALDEYRAEGRFAVDDGSILARATRELAGADETAFAAFVEGILAHRSEATLTIGAVPFTTWWWLEGDEFLGRIALRHRLDAELRRFGGHIGYDVRPSARGRGHATAMVRAVLPVARSMGIERALLTCHHENIASIRVIEACGGVLEDRLGDRLRYWIG